MIDEEIRATISFDPAQLGFSKGIGISHALARTTAAIEAEERYAAILDLKTAYDSVPCEVLRMVLNGKVPDNLVRQAEYFLLPCKFKTQKTHRI